MPFIDFPNIPQSIHVCTQINELKLRSTGVSGRFSALHFRCAYLHRMHLLKFADALQLYVYLLLAVSLPALHMLSYCPDPEPWPGCEPDKSLFRMPMNRDPALLAVFLIGSVMSREKVAELNCLVSCFLIDPFRKRNAIQFIWRAGACACQWSQINIYSIDLL